MFYFLCQSALLLDIYGFIFADYRLCYQNMQSSFFTVKNMFTANRLCVRCLFRSATHGRVVETQRQIKMQMRKAFTVSVLIWVRRLHCCQSCTQQQTELFLTSGQPDSGNAGEVSLSAFAPKKKSLCSLAVDCYQLTLVLFHICLETSRRSDFYWSLFYIWLRHCNQSLFQPEKQIRWDWRSKCNWNLAI